MHLRMNMVPKGHRKICALLWSLLRRGKFYLDWSTFFPAPFPLSGALFHPTRLPMRAPRPVFQEGSETPDYLVSIKYTEPTPPPMLQAVIQSLSPADQRKEAQGLWALKYNILKATCHLHLKKIFYIAQVEQHKASTVYKHCWMTGKICFSRILISNDLYWFSFHHSLMCFFSIM